MSDAPRTIEVELGPDVAGERFDRAVARAAGISRQRAMELLAEGKVLVGRRRPRKGEKVEPGMKLVIELPASSVPEPEPGLDLKILFEDPLLLAIDKPAGRSMHPLEPGERGTVANAVLARYPDVVGASTEERCPGLVHRLDRETSGVVLWARRREAFDHLRSQFAAKTVEKRYVAIVEGFVEGAGDLNVPLAHDPEDARKMIATPYPAEAEKLKARPALTRYKALGHGDGATLLEVEIPTGVMHQIRAHFAFVGYPVRGDTLYGGRPFGEGARHLLHASSIRFEHPDGSGARRVVSPLPADFREALANAGIGPPAD
jgi:23S rRNA pseudouridine1911/1915/1917 synthase